MEEISMLTGQTYAIPTVILRLSKVFGPRQSLKPRSGNFISTALHHLLHNEPPRIHEDGLQTRDFLSVQDATRAMLIAMDREAADCQVFNIGSGTPRTLREVSAILASRLEVEFQPLISGVFRPYSARHLHPDTTKAKLMLKFSAESDFEKTLGEAVEWYRTVIRERNNSSEGLKPGELSVH
jgi:dTDP-L-rhamnose 4-epimerase